MTRHLIRTSLIAALMLFATSAFANNWKTQVQQAGGFWAGKLDASGWNQKIFAADSNRVLSTLPSGVQTMLKAEVVDNPWVKGHEEMTRKLGNFRPESRKVFDLPYIPIPADKMKFKYESSGMSSNMKQNVTFEKNGQRFIRYFFHPLYANKYRELIETYGVKYGEYQAASTSSPRSLVAWKKNAPTKPIWVKVSLHAHLDYYTKRDANGVEKKIGISRVQTEKKARRSALVNAAFNSAGRAELAKSRVDYMAEPASYVPGDIQYNGARRGFDRATIFREIPEALTKTNAQTKFVPAFTFIKNMKPTLAVINAERATAGKRPINAVGWMTKGLIEPLVRTYIHLGMEHGLSGEMHTQNFLLEVSKKGIPTGKIMVKDLDGYRMDLDVRIRNNRSIKFLNHFKNPFLWAKHSATQGSSSNPAVLQGWFNKLIRNVNGFTTTRTVNGVTKKIYSTPAGQLMVQLKKDFPEVMQKMERAAVRRDPSLAGNAEKTTRKAVEQVFDLVAKAQFRRVTGIRIKKEDWGYGQKKGLNNGLGTLRTPLFKSPAGLGAKFNSAGSMEVNQQAQGVLRSTFNRLRTPTERKADERTWIRGTPKTFRYLGDGVIEGISRGGKSVGYAILKPAGKTRLHNDLQRAGLQVPSRTRASSHLKSYSAKDYSAKRPFDRWLNGRPASSRTTARTTRTNTPRATRTARRTFRR
jgi:hypothetical protein